MLYTLLEYLGYPSFTACAVTFPTYISCDMHELQTITNLTHSRNEGDYTTIVMPLDHVHMVAEML
jgi:hypothetical protein